MGLYDTFLSTDGQIAIQLKNGPCLMHEYSVGDGVDPAFEDGIYVGFGGFVVITQEVVRRVTNSQEELGEYKHLPVFSKWGDQITLDDDIDELNPIAQAVKEFAAKFEKVE